MINLMVSSRTSKISGLKWLPGFTNFSLMVAQICQLLPNYGKSNKYLVYTNNFFTNVKFFKYLKKYGLEAYGIAKASSGFLAKLLIFYDILSSKNNWGFLQATTVENSIFCMI